MFLLPDRGRGDTFALHVNRPNAPLTSFAMLLVAALAIAQGLQLLRGALASLSVYLGQVRDVDAELLALVIFAIFLSAFAAPLAWRLLGRQQAWLFLAASLPLLRLAEQLSADPDARLAIQTAGVVTWLWLIPIITLRPASKPGADATARPILALLLGLTIDTAIKGAFWTLDLGFSDSLTPLLTTIAISTVHLALIAWAALPGPTRRARQSTALLIRHRTRSRPARADLPESRSPLGPDRLAAPRRLRLDADRQSGRHRLRHVAP